MIDISPYPLHDIGEIEKCGDTLQKKFKLDGSIATTNMMMFDMNGMIRKFENPLEIMQQFYDVRVEYYGKRKVYLMNTLTESWEKLDNKVRFILRVITGELVVSNRKKIELLSELQSTGFKLFAEKKSVAKKDAELEEGGDGMDDGDDSAVPVGTVSFTRCHYSYLYNRIELIIYSDFLNNHHNIFLGKS
jgi:DNA topoisomerase-2